VADPERQGLVAVSYVECDGRIERIKPMPEDSRPATKQDLNELRDQLREEMRELSDRLVEQMRDMQTEVLRAFHDWASPVEIKLRAIPQLDERLGLLEERVGRLERGKIQH